MRFMPTEPADIFLIGMLCGSFVTLLAGLIAGGSW